MKVTAASALPVLAFLPGGAIAGLLDKRGLECNTIYGEGKVAVKNLPTNVQVQGGKTVEKTVKSRKTVYITPTVTRTLTGVTVVTDRVTQTRTGKPTTVTITGSSTSTVPALAGFTPAAAALPSAQAKVAHKYYHAKRDASATPAAASAAAPKVAAAKVAVSVNCVKIAAGVTTVTRTVAQKPYVTKYGRPETRTVNRQRTRHVEKIVATTTIHKKSVVELPRATHWAACQNDNLLSWTWGKGGAGVSSNSTFGGSNGTSSSHVGISSVVLVAGTSAKSFDTSTATQCCIKCQTTPGCVGSQWRSGVCNIHIRPAAFATCSAHSSFSLGSFFANPLSFLGDGEGLILSNGRCGGTWKYGGLTS